jgi:DNA-binding response OmpR family regulator
LGRSSREHANPAGAVVTALRVLIVEDEESIVAPFVRALERNGFEPVVARMAAEALRAASERSHDVVLLDLALPDAGGRDQRHRRGHRRTAPPTS